jgi:hypothetical protein
MPRTLEQKRVESRAHYWANRDAAIARTKTYREANRDRYAGYRDRYKSSPENRIKHGLYVKQWLLDNPAKAKLKKIRMSANRRGIQCLIRPNEFVEWLSSQNSSCSFCGISEEGLKKLAHPHFSKLTIDRKNNDGPYSIDNICLACYKCNTKKGNDIPFDVMVEIGQKYLKPLWLARMEA